MLKVLLLFSLILTSLWADLEWSTSYQRAFSEAKDQDKGVLIILTQANCNACYYLENIVFEDDVLSEKISNEYIPLNLDIHDDDLHGLTYRGTPTLYFLNAKGVLLKRLDGVYNIKELTAAMKKIEKIDEDEE